MSRKSRKSTRPQKSQPLGATQNLAPSAQIYDAANFSTRRGFIPFTTTATSEELPSYARAELLRQGRWLKANSGSIRGLIKNSATLVGWKTPHAQSTDIEWNKERDRSFNTRNKARIVFDSAGKFTFKTAQKMLLERSFEDGDILVVFTETPSAGARCAFYEAHQLVNPPEADSKLWKEGVRINKDGSHLAYGVKSGDTVKIISARDAFLFGTFDSVGHTRPHPPLGYALNHARDIAETRGFVKLALKNSSLFGVYEESTAGANTNQTVGGMHTVALPGRPVSKDDGTGTGKKIKTAEIYDGGVIPETRPGTKLSVVTDTRPSPNQMVFEDALFDEIATGWGLAKEVVLMMGKKLSGPSVRFIMAMAEQWIEDKQMQLDEFCHRYWVYDTAKEIKAGRLRESADENWMQSLKLTKRRSLTIDRQQGKQRLDELDAGAGTLADWIEETTGDDWRDHVDQVAEEHAYKVQAAESRGFKYEQVFRPRQGSAAVDPTPEPEPAPAPEED
jgi:hypothetical protein